MSEEKVKFTGRDLAEAMGAARRHFNASRAEVAYEMVGEAKVGPLEGTPSVEIYAWRRTPEDVAERAAQAEAREARAAMRRGGRDERGGRRDRGDRGDRGDRDRGPRGDRRGEGPRRPREEDEGPVELPPLLPAAETTSPEEILRHLAERFVGGFGLDLAVDAVETTSAGLRVSLSGEDEGLLWENEGEGLEALQYLANRVLQKDGRVEGRVSIDAGGRRGRAEARLVAEALQLADEVAATGEVRKMAAMGPYERRLVHVALADRKEIRTFSTGTGYHRRLHIAPAGKGDAPEESGDAPTE